MKEKERKRERERDVDASKLTGRAKAFAVFCPIVPVPEFRILLRRRGEGGRGRGQVFVGRHEQINVLFLDQGENCPLPSRQDG